MTNVFLQHNPFTVETIILMDEKEIGTESKLANFKHERLQMWLEMFIPILVEECNDDLNITFKGIQLDYEDLVIAVDEYTKKDGNTNINLKHVSSRDVGDRLKEITDLFNYLQSECPFEDLRDQQVRDNFYSAIGKEFEVSVIATMSSGKSTLINAMLGNDLMPSENKACTAMIARIKDVDGKENFSAVCKDAQNKTLISSDFLTLEVMKEYNKNPNVSFIDIEGDIPFVTTKSVDLVLQDTPGPNNSRTDEHKNHTYRVIKEKSMPMVLYVLNATQLETNDDSVLLSSVAEAMKIGGKQAKDRFIFAVNKIDTFDTGKGEAIEGAIKNVREYLSKHGIENPNIYPTSAEMARVIRLSNNNYKLSTKEQCTKATYILFNEDSQMHLSKYAPLSFKSKEKLDKMLEKAISSGNPYEETLIHTGVPAVEIAINEYLDKYALTNKIKTAVDTFIKKIHDKKLIDNLAKEIENNEKARVKLNEDLLSVEQQLNDGKKAISFKEKIEKLDLRNEVNEKIEKTNAKITKVLPPLTGSKNTKMSPLEVEQFLTKLKREIDNLQSYVKTELESIVQDTIVSNANSIHQEYLEYIKTLVDSKALAVTTFKSNATINILSNDTPSASELINKFKFTESVKTGEKWVENTSKKWYKPWTWLQESGSYRDIYEDKDFVDTSKVYAAFVTPIKMNFDENLANAKVTANTEAEKFKKFFMNEIDNLNRVLKNKVLELQAITESKKSVSDRIKEDENKIKWLDEFLFKLDSILEI